MDVVRWNPDCLSEQGFCTVKTLMELADKCDAVGERVSATLMWANRGQASSSGRRLPRARDVCDARRCQVRVGDAQRVRLAKEPCSWQGCASRATLGRPPVERSPAVKGRPDRAERSEPRSGALDGWVERSYPAYRATSGVTLTTPMPREPQRRWWRRSRIGWLDMVDPRCVDSVCELQR